MNNAKKIVSLLLVVALTAGIAIAGTLAYLTQDVGDEKNVFSVGNIDITLDEEVGVYGEGGEVKKTEDGAEYTDIMPGDYLKKEVTVYNNGKTDAYVAVTVDVNNFKQIQKVIEAYGEDDVTAEAMLDFVFDGWGMTVRDRYVDGEKDMSYKINELVDSHILHVDSAKRIVANDVAHFSIENWFKSDAEKASSSYTVAGVGNSYYLTDKEDYSLCYTYYLYLPAGESTTLFKGLNVPAEFTNEQMKMFNGLEINVEAEAIQADNITVDKLYADDAVYGEAKTAFAILAGDIDGESIYSDITPEDGSLTLENGAIVKLTGTQEALTVYGNGTLVLEDASFNVTDGSALTIASGSNVTVSIVGYTALSGTNGIEVAEGAVLNLSGSGELTATGSNGNGIGGAGTINISGLSSLTAEGNGKHAFGIGGESKNITITNTTIKKVSGGHVGEAGTDTSYYKDAPEGGCAIGSSTNGAVITLNNVKIAEANGGSKAAGIGASYWTTVTVNITGCEISSVSGGVTAAGIGGSRIHNDGHNTTTINISDSTINAKGGVYGAGIGSGYDTYCHSGDLAPVCTINITGNSNIDATGGTYAAGIGTGYHAGGLAGEIAKTVIVNATSGVNVDKDTYTHAMDVGFGVLDPTRDGFNNTSTFTYNGEKITVPAV